MCWKILCLLLSMILFHLSLAGSLFLILYLEHLELSSGEGERNILGKRGRSDKLLSVYGIINDFLYRFQQIDGW